MGGLQNVAGCDRVRAWINYDIKIPLKKKKKKSNLEENRIGGGGIGGHVGLFHS